MYSIIVPIYDSEKYLSRCIDSILCQTSPDFELILVDDGSKDKSADICKKYAERDERVRYVRQENAGVSAARNHGIQLARGEYIGFVDSDDEICREMYETLLSDAFESSADIVICDAVTVYSDGRTEDDALPLAHSDKLIRKNEIKPEQLLYMAGAAWRCIYKKTLFDDENIRFPIGIKLSEDRIFNILAMGKSNGIYYEKKGLYKRHIVVGSAVNKYHKDYFSTVIRASQKTVDALIFCGFGAEFIKIYGEQTVNGAMSAVYNEFHRDCEKTFSEKIAALKQICSDETVQNALESHGKGFKFTLMRKKKVYLLSVLAKVRSILK